ncbi:MAG: MYG1 family protein [Kiritimatiellae bacterium]|nr:MYG1 family protein [Kiritimatiellia bacterium]MDW8458904.1 MYG1 family protein [Verrucomicrobiota bacterium]
MPHHRLIVVASEQIWPNLYSIEWLVGEPAGLASLEILHTADAHRSIQPARRLQRLVERNHSGTVVHMHPIDMQPARLYEKMASIVAGDPKARWVVNLTGGNKLIAIGLSQAVGKVPAQFIYREIDGAWYEFRRENGLLTGFPIAIPEDRVNSLPLDELLSLHFSTQHDVRWEGRDPRCLPLEQLFRAAYSNEWDWRDAFQTCGLGDAGAAAGALFEEVIAALASAFQPASIWLNAKAITAEGRVETELDVVTHDSGIIVYLDCKLALQEDKAALIQQIRDAGSALRALGGSNARGVLIRPNCTFDDIQRSYAASLNLAVIDRSRFTSIVEELARIYRKPVPDALRGLNEFLRTQPAPPSRPSRPTSEESPPEEIPGILNADRWSDQTLTRNQRTWTAVWVTPNILYVRHYEPESALDRHILTRRAENYWGQFGQILDLSLARRGLTLRLLLKVRANNLGLLENTLRRMQGNFSLAGNGPIRPPDARPRRIITHSGNAHADEIAAILVALAADDRIMEIRRVREVSEDELRDPTTYVVDIGRRHDRNLKNFDHHQFPAEPSTCSFLLMLEHFELLDDAKRYWPWIETFARIDAIGAATVAQTAGFPAERLNDLLANPIELAFTSYFSQIDRLEGHHPFFRALVDMGKRLVSDLKSCRREEDRLAPLVRTLEWSPGARAIVIPSARHVPPAVYSAVSRILVRERCPDARAIVAEDPRGEGWAIMRLDTCPPESLDFRRLQGDPSIVFVHASGFLATTRAMLPDNLLCELLRRADIDRHRPS